MRGGRKNVADNKTDIDDKTMTDDKRIKRRGKID